MDDAASGQSVWSLQGTLGKLRCEHFSGEVDVARPTNGLKTTALSDGRMPYALVGVYRTAKSPAPQFAERADNADLWSLPVADAYVRGRDLVASYGPADDWPYSPQLYWQANSLDSVADVLGSLSLLVSLQTHLLDTWPQISVASQLPAGESLRLSISDNGHAEVGSVEQVAQVLPVGVTCCILRRPSEMSLSYVEIMHTTDFRELVIRPDANGVSCVEWRLFADFLEKGVIRRARVHAALVPRKNDIELAVECCRALQQSPLPLTT